MDRKIVLSAFVSVLLLSTVFGTNWLSGPITSATPKTWTVDDDRVQCPDADFTTIQEAINHADPHARDTIEVYPSKRCYYESIIIDKPINLIGVQGRYETIIDAGHTEETSYQVVTIKSPNVRIENFSIQHVAEANQSIGAGIRLQSGKGLLYGIVIHNNVISNVGMGIDCGYFAYVDLHDSHITENNITKIWFEGIHLSGGTDFVVSENIIDDVAAAAISMGDVNNATISQNNINDAQCGLKLERGDSNNITGNTFTEIRNWGALVGGTHNIVNDNKVTSPNGILVNGNSSKFYNNTVIGHGGLQQFGFSVGGVDNEIYNNTLIGNWEKSIWSHKLANNFTINKIHNVNVGMYNVNVGMYNVGYSSGNEIHDCSIGIHIPSTKSYVTLFNNSFHNCEQGVRVEGNFSNINSNSFHNCEQGVRVEGNFSNINSNTFVSNYATNGIELCGCYNNVTRNLFLRSNCSICLLSASFNDITENTIYSSVRFIDSYNSQYNRLRHNDVFNVTSYPCCEEASTNEYEYNYWDDYIAHNGMDKNGDGYGNIRYRVASTETYDNSPLDVPFRSFPIFWEDEEYDCRMLGNLAVSNICFDHSSSCLQFNIAVPDSAEAPSRYNNLIIPRSILDGHFKVMIDDTVIPSILSWNDNHTSVCFTYSEKGIHSVKVIAEIVTKDLARACDINGDGRVDIIDISQVAINFGKIFEDL